jgi:hypothetical protein
MLLAGRARRQHGAEVAHRALRVADVQLQNAPHALVELALLVELNRSEADALLIDLGRIAVPAARVATADVHPVGPTDREADQRIAEEHRSHHGHVVEVRAHGVRVVAEIDVAGTQVLLADVVLQRADGLPQIPEENRQSRGLGHHLPVAIEETHAEVEHLVDDRVVGRSEKGDLHLIARRYEPVADQFQSDGMDFVRNRLGVRLLRCVHYLSGRMLKWPAGMTSTS